MSAATEHTHTTQSVPCSVVVRDFTGGAPDRTIEFASLEEMRDFCVVNGPSVVVMKVGKPKPTTDQATTSGN